MEAETITSGLRASSLVPSGLQRVTNKRGRSVGDATSLQNGWPYWTPQTPELFPKLVGKASRYQWIIANQGGHWLLLPGCHSSIFWKASAMYRMDEPFLC